MKLNYKSTAVAILVVAISSLHVNAQAQRTKPAPQLGKSSLKDVINAMTLQEKSKLVVGMGFRMPGTPPPKKDQKPQSTDIGGFKLPPSDPDAFNVPERVPGAAGRTHAIPR